MRTELSDYRKGYFSYNLGKSPETNPYDEWDEEEQFLDWLDGYNDAADEDQEDEN